MRILNSVAHSDGVWVEAVVDTSADLSSLETYAAEFFKGAPEIVEGSIVLATREAAFYVKDSSGAWVKQGEGSEDSGNSNTANLTFSGVSTAPLEKVGKFNGETLASAQNAPDALSEALEEQEQEETPENNGDEVSEDAVGDTESK